MRLFFINFVLLQEKLYFVKKVLLITYYFPPSGGAGVQRWLKTINHLHEFGVETIVLTVDPQVASYPQIDESLCNEVPDFVKVYKTKTKFLLSDEQFDFLRNLQVEYDYILADNVILIDRHPSVLENHVPEDLLNDYINHMNDKFSVLYEYKQVDYV